MVVCRFFQQGNCKFGDKCRYEHPQGQGYNQYNQYRGGGNQYGGGGGMYGNRFGALANQQGDGRGQKVADPSPQEIVEDIKREMVLWESSKMWLFSCYSYAKEAPCISGFKDYSPEEMRYEAYKAEKGGSFASYTQSWNHLCMEYIKKIKALVCPNEDLQRTLMQEILNHKQGFGTSQNLNGSTSGSFNQTATTPSGGLFSSQSGTAPNVNPFSTPTSTTAPTSLFGKPVQAGQASTGGFLGMANTGGTSSGNPFGGSSSGFLNTSASNNTFGSPVSTGAQVLLPAPTGGTASTGAQGLLPTPIGGPASTSSQGLLPTPAGGGGLVSPVSSSGIGGNTGSISTQSTASVFPGVTTQTFTSQQQQQTFGAQQPVSGVFGNQQQQPHQPIQQTKSSLYTPLSHLTAEERQQFEAPKFTLGKIPMKPPPIELV